MPEKTLQAESCASSDHKHLLQFPGCARSKQLISAQSDIFSLRDGFENGSYTDIAIVDGVLETFSHFDAGRNLQRPSGTRFSLSHSVFFDFVPSNITGRSFPARLFIFEDHKAVTHMIITGYSAKMIHVCLTVYPKMRMIL